MAPPGPRRLGLPKEAQYAVPCGLALATSQPWAQHDTGSGYSTWTVHGRQRRLTEAAREGCLLETPQKPRDYSVEQAQPAMAEAGRRLRPPGETAGRAARLAGRRLVIADCVPLPGPPLRRRQARRVGVLLTAAGRTPQMTDDQLAVVLAEAGQEVSELRCLELIRTERGWERCHRDEHTSDARHHVRDRSWSTAGNTPRLRLGQPCTSACAWPDQVMKYRGRLTRPT